MVEYKSTRLPAVVSCPYCGGKVDYDEDAQYYSCVSKGICTWGAYEDELGR